MAALLPVSRIKRDNGCGAASLLVKQANKHKELLLLMPKWATRSLLDKLLPLLSEHGGSALPAAPGIEGRYWGLCSPVFLALQSCCPLLTTGK